MITVTLGDASAEAIELQIDRTEGDAMPLRFSSSALPLAATGDAALVATLPLAVWSGQALRVDLPVSRRLSDNVGDLVEILSVWWRRPERIAVHVDVAVTGRAGRVHGGLADGSIPAAHLAVGPDAPAQPMALSSAAGPGAAVISSNGEAIGRAFGLEWESQYEAIVAIAAAHSTAELSRFDLAAPFSVHYLFPWTSHPLLDRLWSGDSLDVRTRHAELDWMQRLEVVAGGDEGLGALSVCRDEPTGAACERCRRCLFLAAGLAVLGRGAPDEVDLAALERLDLHHYTALTDTAVLLRHTRERGHEEIRAALEHAVGVLGPADVHWPDNWYQYLDLMGTGS